MSSLVSTALRIAARRAISGATFAGQRVHDSAISPIDHMVETGQAEPFIVVSSEDETALIKTRDVTGGDRSIDLVIEVAIAHPVTANADGGSEIVIPATDAGLELSLSLIVRQVYRALFEQRGNVWADVFARFVLNVEKATNKRGVGNRDGARFAARQLVLTLDTLHEPPFGHVPASGEPWGDFLAAMEADDELATLAPLVRQSITGTPTIEDWDRTRSDLGLTEVGSAHIGLRGAGGLISEEPAIAQDGTFEDMP